MMQVRARIALVTAALVAVVLAVGSTLLYVQLRNGLVESVDAALLSRAEALAASGVDRVGSVGLVEPDEAFSQVLSSDAAVLESSPGVRAQPLLSSRDLEGLDERRLFQRVVATVEEPVEARLLAVPLGGGDVLVVGASLDDQQEALARLRILLYVGGPLAVLLIAGVGWLVAGVALRPVERMRSEAAAISVSELDRRLPVPRTRDELARLGVTLNEMLQRLEEGLRRERRFVDDASHELRTPLANLRAELELALRRSRSAEELERVIRSAAEETDALARLAEDLLVLARAGDGRLPVRRERVDVSDLVADVVDGFRARASANGVSLVRRFDDGVAASADPMRLRQALRNLLDNALRHTPARGEVTVGVSRSDGWLSFAVDDTGPGFPPGFLESAFEPFTRPDAARGRREGGHGLGLLIVRAIAEAHGGTVEAANRDGGGATVTLRIPS